MFISSFTYLYISMFIYLLIYFYINMFISLLIYLFTYLFIYLFIYFYFSTFLLFYFSTFLLFYFSTFLLFYFSTFLLFYFSTFLSLRAFALAKAQPCRAVLRSFLFHQKGERIVIGLAPSPLLPFLSASYRRHRCAQPDRYRYTHKNARKFGSLENLH